jgi:hypothetical protein
MSVLGIILLKDLIQSPETINSNWESEKIDISYREDEFSLQLIYDAGFSVDMDLYLSVSNDDIHYSRLQESKQTITEDSGSHIWSIFGEGAVFLRVEIEVNSGSIDLQKLLYRAKRRH